MTPLLETHLFLKQVAMGSPSSRQKSADFLRGVIGEDEGEQF